MIKILAVFVLTIMCYFIAKKITYASMSIEDHFFWGWLSAIATGFFINWFVELLNDGDQ